MEILTPAKQIIAQPKVKKFVTDFKTFAVKGNVLDMAIGVIIGAAFGKIVTSAVNDLIMPLLGLVIGKVDLKSLFFALDGKSYPSIEAAKQATAPILTYGNFLQMLFDFLIVALVIFLVLKRLLPFLTREQEKAAAPPPAPTTKECPECLMSIPLAAKRCGHCTVVFSR
jgi:large conductance mechanosensitive channel